MIEAVKRLYEDRFGKQPILVKAPGRINLIGEHTDYNNGFVMPAAIDKAMYFAMGKQNAGNLNTVCSVNYKEEISFTITSENTLPAWGRYLKAILTIFSDRGLSIAKINCILGGDIPVGAGLSSSAALCCGFIFGLSDLFDLNLSKKEIALIAQEAEHRIGLNCGLMDQYAVLFGKEDHVFCLDCQTLGLNYFPMKLEDYALVLINSKIEHELEGSPYNDRRNSCEAVVAIIAKDHPEVKSLRDVKKNLLVLYKEQISSLDFIRAKYVLEENERVTQMIKALEQARFAEVGEILFRGHQGMSEEYDISLPEIDYLVELARAEPAILGSRMMGGGFGGCTINLVEKQNSTRALRIIKEKYLAKTGIEAEIYKIKLCDGLQKVEM